MAYGFKTGGRQKGTPNKNTQAVSENLRAIFMDEFESGRVQDALRQLDPEDYIAALLKWSQFVFPKPRPADAATEPHAPEEPQVNDAAPAEEPRPEGKVQVLEDPVLDGYRKRLVSGAEIERFRRHMNWTEDQVKRFIAGESPESIDSEQ